MRKIVVWGYDNDGCAAAIEQLKRTGAIEVVAWFANRDRYAGCDYDVRDFFTAKLPTSWDDGTYRDAKLHACHDALRERLPLFLDMASRTEFLRYADIHDGQDWFALLVRYFYGLLVAGEVETLLMSNLPHFGVDYVLYAVAEQLGIETILTSQSLEPNRFFCVRSLEDFGQFTTTEPIPLEKQRSVAQGFQKELFYMKVRPRRKTPYGSLLSRSAKWLLGNRRRMRLFEIVKRFEQEREFKRDARRFPLRAVDLQRPFVMFPLHLQPELTTSALGGIFSDQLLAVERLRQLLPADWSIYVKENPKQQYKQRDEKFFARLARIPNTLLLHSEFSNYELLEHCQFVATLTGTAGWEAISGGKPALVFGRPWYASLPGVVSYRSDLTCQEIVSIEFTHRQVEAAYNRLLEKTRIGVVDSLYCQLVENYSCETNAEHICRFLSQQILQSQRVAA